MKKYFSQFLALIGGISLGLVGTAMAATTISTNISTGGTLTVTGAVTTSGTTGVRFLSIDRSDSSYHDFFFYQSTGGGFAIRADGTVGVGTTTPYSKFHVTSGASATTTVSIGEIGDATSKGCVNMKRSDGGAASFFITAAGVMVVETTYCK